MSRLGPSVVRRYDTAVVVYLLPSIFTDVLREVLDCHPRERAGRLTDTPTNKTKHRTTKHIFSVHGFRTVRVNILPSWWRRGTTRLMTDPSYTRLEPYYDSGVIYHLFLLLFVFRNNSLSRPLLPVTSPPVTHPPRSLVHDVGPEGSPVGLGPEGDAPVNDDHEDPGVYEDHEKTWVHVAKGRTE